MTTMFKGTVNCRICSKKSEHDIIVSTNTFGSLDLDTRPPAHMRYTINTWVQRCPHCGYCASNIEKVSKAVDSRINSQKYQYQLGSSKYPELASSFLCKAMLENVNGDLAQSTWTTIHAAWACDDSRDDQSAKQCRIQAVNLIREAELSGQTISDEPGADLAITVDLLRRAGHFNEALKMIEHKQGEIEDEMIRNILEFQKDLISRYDTSCHAINEAIKHK